MDKTTQISDRKALINWAKENLKERTVTPKNFGMQILFTTKGIKEYINQPHKHYLAKNELIKFMPEILENAEYIGKAKKDESGYIVASHIFEIAIKDDKSWLIARENLEGVVTFYGISDSKNVLLGIKK